MGCGLRFEIDRLTQFWAGFVIFWIMTNNQIGNSRTITRSNGLKQALNRFGTWSNRLYYISKSRQLIKY